MRNAKKAVRVFLRSRKRIFQSICKIRMNISVLTSSSSRLRSRLFIEKKHKVESVKKHYERVERERASMEKRMSLILKAVRRKIGQVFSFKELIQNTKDRYDIVVTFLSLLEMAKERVIRVDQQVNYGDITVSAGERVHEDTVLESYDAAESGSYDEEPASPLGEAAAAAPRTGRQWEAGTKGEAGNGNDK